MYSWGCGYYSTENHEIDKRNGVEMEMKRFSLSFETETQRKRNAIEMETQRSAKNAWNA